MFYRFFISLSPFSHMEVHCFIPREGNDPPREKLVARHPHIRSIGGSELASVMNISSFCSRKQFIDKCLRIYPALPPRTQLNQAMLDGLDYERCARVLVKRLFPDDQLLHDTSRPWDYRLPPSLTYTVPFCVSTDGFLIKSRRVLEVKTLSRYTTRKTVEEEWVKYPFGIHPKYYPQVELYCRAMNCDRAIMLFLLPNESCENKQLFDMIVDYPYRMMETLSDEQIQKMCIVREYHSTKFMWMGIIRMTTEILTYCGKSEQEMPFRKIQYTKDEMIQQIAAGVMEEENKRRSVMREKRRRALSFVLSNKDTPPI